MYSKDDAWHKLFFFYYWNGLWYLKMRSLHARPRCFRWKASTFVFALWSSVQITRTTMVPLLRLMGAMTARAWPSERRGGVASACPCSADRDWEPFFFFPLLFPFLTTRFWCACVQPGSVSPLALPLVPPRTNCLGRQAKKNKMVRKAK